MTLSGPASAGPAPSATRPATRPASRGAAWRPGIPFVAVHLACLAVLVVGWSPFAVGVCAALYAARMFGITAFYHRYFAHRAFRVSRPVALAGALLGAAAAQRGPLWWAAHHRRHHRATDRPGDPHSPVQDGFWASHLLWLFAPANQATDLDLVPDLAAVPELRLLDRYPHLVPAGLAGATFGAGALAGHLWPALHTSGLQLLVWGFCISTVVLYHATFAVNSFGHLVGRRRYETTDSSRNSLWLALATLGEGWHNNHHRFPGAARQGFARWELDLTWLSLVLMAKVRLVHDLRPVPARILAVARSRVVVLPPVAPSPRP